MSMPAGVLAWRSGEGTLNLFAAFEVDTGRVHTKFTESKKRADFLGFLDGVLDGQPQDREPRHPG